MTTKTTTESMVDRLLDLGTIVERGFERRIYPLGVSVPQLRILEAVARETMQPKGLAALIKQEPHSATGLLNRLEDRGLIVRSRNNLDRRNVFVDATPAGVALVEAAAVHRGEVEALVGKVLAWLTITHDEAESLVRQMQDALL